MQFTAAQFRRQALPVELSRRALLRVAGEGAPPTPSPLRKLGTTFSMAQEVRWLDEQKFAIGRWDGNLTIFHLPSTPNAGPTITSAAVSPAFSGVEMIANVTRDFFVSSLDGSTIAVWEEGLLWVGGVHEDRLLDGTSTPVSSHFGAALNFEPSQRFLAIAGDNIDLFQLE